MKRKILLIEDNTELRDNTAEIIGLSNYDVLSAQDGKQGLEMAIKELPDLIICDIMMPVLDGYGVIHALQKNEHTRNIPFIFFSAKSEKQDWRKGMDLGADDYITKPFSGAELLSAIERRLKKSDLLKQDYGNAIEQLKNIVGIEGNEKDMLALFKENTIQFKKKEVIYRDGNKPKSIFYIQKGKVKTYKTNEEGKELIIDLLGEGDFIGYLPVLGETNYTESAETLEESIISELSITEFEKLLYGNRTVLEKFAKIMSNNMIEKERQLLSIAYNSLRKKVAESLLTLSAKYKPSGDAHFSMQISRENLASIAGTATESLIRTLSDFKDEKLIEIKDGKITLINEPKLRTMVN